MAVAEARIAPIQIGSRFAPYHKWDRNLFLVLVGLVWLGIVRGFGPVILKHMQTGQSHPLIIHFHAAFFVGWLLRLTTQMLLIRVRRTDLHRKLGMVGTVMVPAMVVLGTVAGIMT